MRAVEYRRRERRLKETMPLPNKSLVLEVNQVNETSYRIETDAMTELFGAYPSNTNEAQVLLKVVVLNDVRSVAGSITACGEKLDHALARGGPEAVELIVHQRLGDKDRYVFSFACKYCHWHNPEA
jgi:hypothetical protein